ncbi:SRPBCC domain-containing protein [Nocardioides euryhalodurans]|nr:SRPBCC domain-containing protein [Nocardioides euryhalodurans]
MTTFEARTDIAATPSRVWDELLDLTAWPSRDTSLGRLEGSLVPGGRVTIHVEGSSRAFRLRVVELEPGRRVVLRGGMPLGLFSGTRHYTLEPSGDGRTTFTMAETYAGLLSPLVTRSIPDMQPAFEAFAAGLRRDAEAATSVATHDREDRA